MPVSINCHLKSSSAEKDKEKQAGVAQHGQRRRTEAPILQRFVGSNPTPRTIGSFLAWVPPLFAIFGFELGAVASLRLSLCALKNINLSQTRFIAKRRNDCGF